MATAMAAILLLFILAAPTVHSVQYTVPWTIGINYGSWAAGKTFSVGDVLVFSYTADHSVDVVSTTDAAGCITGNPLASFTGGKSSIPLTAPGTMNFICPTEGHCLAGMKLTVTVAGAGATPTTPSTPPPSNSKTTPATPPPTAVATPPPTAVETPSTAPTATLTISPSLSPSVSPAPASTVESPSGSPSPAASSPATSATTTTTASSPSGAGSMFGDGNHLVVLGFSVVVVGLAGFMV